MGLGLFTHLQQGIDGSILVPSLGFKHGADYFSVHVGKHVLDSLEILLITAGLRSHSWWGHGHRHHARAADGRHP